MTSPTLWPMRGGILPPAHKSKSSATSIQRAGIPPLLILSLQQRQGDAIPIVSIGQRVRKGEVIAIASDAMSSPLHASSSGEIIAIEMRPVALRENNLARCIVIRTDGLDEWIERANTTPMANIEDCEPAELLDRIARAGVVGAGGAGFPAARKLVDARGNIQKIDTLIINGAECEPYISADDRLMRERATDIVRGIQVLQRILQPQKTLLGIEDNKAEALEAMRKAALDSRNERVSDDAIDVIAVPSRYPIGSEALLIYTLSGREVPSDGIPADIGVLCFNVGTVAAIYRAAIFDEPMLSRIVTIGGEACASSGNFETLIGTPLRTLLEKAEWKESDCAQLFAGGPLTGFAIDSADTPITKTSHAFIAGAAAEFPPTSEPLACIRCGYCAEACPVALQPQQLHVHARLRNDEQLQALGLFDCIECGACDYVCPSHIPLIQSFRESKRELKIIVYEQQQAVVARERFNAHQTRLARNKIERDIQRQQRLSASSAITATQEIEPSTITTNADTNKQAAILAAIARAKAKKSAAPQRLAAFAALAETTPLSTRLRQRIDDIERLMLNADSDERRARLQRALDDLQSHLADTEKDVDANSKTDISRDQIEQALVRALTLTREQAE